MQCVNCVKMDYDVEEGIPRDLIEFDFAEDALDFEILTGVFEVDARTNLAPHYTLAPTTNTPSQLAEARDVRFTQPLGEPLSIGSHIICTGTPSEDLLWFAVNIGLGEPDMGHGDIAVHFNVRLPQCYVVRNTRRHGKWGSEETTSFRLFPFKPDRPFTIEILVDKKETLWAVDGEPFCNYAHRTPTPFVAEWVQVTGIRDATLNVQKTGHFPTLRPPPFEVPMRSSLNAPAGKDEPTWHPNVLASLARAIPEGHELIIYGSGIPKLMKMADHLPKGHVSVIHQMYHLVLRPLLHSFTINLMDAARYWPPPDVLLHVNIRAYVEAQRSRQLVVLNTWCGGEWGAERRQRTARLVPDTYVKIRIVRGPGKWSVYTDGKVIGELDYRAPAAGVRAVLVRGDIYPEQIYLCPVATHIAS